jgi:tight adherence protein B
VRDINLGIPVREALSRLVAKLDTLPDVRMFATAVTIQREAGGNLAEVLENLGYTIRERFKLKGQIAALTGQSRLTGYVLGCAPAGILILLSIFMFDYVSPLYNTAMGHIALVVVVILQSIGFFVMKKIIDIRV